LISQNGMLAGTSVVRSSRLGNNCSKKLRINLTDKQKHSYKQLQPSAGLSTYIDSYWESVNHTNRPQKRIIVPDSFFKLVVTVIDSKIAVVFLTGLSLQQTEIVIPARATIYGIKFKILAPEYILQREIASLLQSQSILDSDFWGISDFDISSLEAYVLQIEEVISGILTLGKQVQKKNLQLTKLLYEANGNISPGELSTQVGWSLRQITRYLNKNLGASLRTYLNIQKVYAAYIPIREGSFYPKEGFHDQPHLIKQIRKHTGHTPTSLHSDQNDRFVQLKNIKKK